MSYRIATRYAKSLIELAQEKGMLEEVNNDMKLIDSTIHSSAEFKTFLKSPIINADKKQGVLNKIFLNSVTEITGKFIILLTNKGREPHLAEIAESFLIQYNEMKHITPVTITSAVKLDKATIDSMLAGLREREHIKEVQLTETIDPALLGGFTLQYGDKQIDSSVRSSLQKLHNLVADDSYVKNIR